MTPSFRIIVVIHHTHMHMHTLPLSPCSVPYVHVLRSDQLGLNNPSVSIPEEHLFCHQQQIHWIIFAVLHLGAGTCEAFLVKPVVMLSCIVIIQVLFRQRYCWDFGGMAFIWYAEDTIMHVPWAFGVGVSLKIYQSGWMAYCPLLFAF